MFSQNRRDKYMDLPTKQPDNCAQLFNRTHGLTHKIAELISYYGKINKSFLQKWQFLLSP